MKKVCFCDLKSWYLKLLLLMLLLRLWCFSKVYWEVWGEISQAVHRLWGLRWRLTAGLPPKTCKWGELAAKCVIDRDPPTHKYDNFHEKKMLECRTASPSLRSLNSSLVLVSIFKSSHHQSRGKVMSQEANKLQMPFLANSIYSRDPISKMSINCRSPFWPIQFIVENQFGYSLLYCPIHLEV